MASRAEIGELESLVDREVGQVYTTPAQRAAYRAGLSTAAMACDSIARAHGTKSKIGRAQRDVATQCGDAIDALRRHIQVERS